MITFLMVIEDEVVRDRLEELYRLYKKDLFVTAYSILKDFHDAEDAVQNTMIRLSKNLHKITDINCKKTRAYLVIIVRNISIDIYNKRKGVASIPFEEMSRVGDEFRLDEEIIKLEESKELADILSKLYEPYGDILTLRYYNDLSISEIACTLDITENNVSVRINRALKSLKKVMDKGGAILEKTV